MIVSATANRQVRSMVRTGTGWVKGPYRLEIVADVHQPALQAAPERMTPLLLEHLALHER